MPVALTAAQTRFLRGQAHDLKALLQIGNKGVTPAFLAELDAVLEQHELVKVKVAGDGGCCHTGRCSCFFRVQPLRNAADKPLIVCD